MFTHVLCAVDLRSRSARAMRQAAGLAHASGATLSLVHATNGTHTQMLEARTAIEADFLRAAGSEAAYSAIPSIHLVHGEPASAIVIEAARVGADLIVAGTRGLGPVAAWVSGSTTRLLLQTTSVPLLLVPDGGPDVLTPGADRAHLHCGPVIAAIDPADVNPPHVAVASAFAALVHEPLMLMSAIARDDEGADASEHLRYVAQASWPERPDTLIVRRGEVVQEIGRAALAEGAGVVVMGLRQPQHGVRPGQIATAVLETKRALVLAVPDMRPARGEPAGTIGERCAIAC